MNIHDREEFHSLRELVDDLERRGVLKLDEQRRISYVRPERAEAKKSQSSRVVGPLKVSKRGIGMVRVPGTETDILIAPGSMGTAFHGDVVAVIPFARRVSQRRGAEDAAPEGEVVEIVERRVQTITGTLKKARNFLFVEPDDRRYSRDVYVSRESARKAHEGDKVVVRLLPWTDPHLNPEGAIEEVLGLAGDARVEVMSVARGFGLPTAFPREVEREAAQLPGVIPPSEIASAWTTDLYPQ